MPKSVPSPTKTLHVPSDVHRRIAILARLRQESLQETTAKALVIGVRGLKKARKAASEASPN